MNLKLRVGNVVRDLPAEFRAPVMAALNFSDGSVEGFKMEMQTQVWDFPDMPVHDILRMVEEAD